MAPEEVDSYECVNVLNYFGFPFDVEEDNVVKQIVKLEMGFEKDAPYPCLMIESTQDEVPSMDVAGGPMVFKSLIEKGFIGDHQSHSAKEKQTRFEFINSRASPLFEACLFPFKHRLQFYSVPKHFAQVKLKWEVSDFASNYFWRFYRTVFFHRQAKLVR